MLTSSPQSRPARSVSSPIAVASTLAAEAAGRLTRCRIWGALERGVPVTR